MRLVVSFSKRTTRNRRLAAELRRDGYKVNPRGTKAFLVYMTMPHDGSVLLPGRLDNIRYSLAVEQTETHCRSEGVTLFRKTTGGKFKNTYIREDYPRNVIWHGESFLLREEHVRVRVAPSGIVNIADCGLVEHGNEVFLHSRDVPKEEHDSYRRAINQAHRIMEQSGHKLAS